MDAPNPGPTQTPSERDARGGVAPKWLLLVLLLGSLGFWANYARIPLDGTFRLGFQHHNAARYAIQGRNYVRHGFAENLGAPDYSPGAKRPPEERSLYLHHPPLVPLLVGASFLTLGESERNAQLPFFVIGALVPLVVFLLGRRMFGSGGGALAAAFCAVAPMGTLYGGHVDPQGPIVVIAVVASIWAYLRFRASRRGADLAWVAVFATLGLMSDWSAAYPLGVIAAAETFLPGGSRDRRVWLLPLVPIAFFLAYLGWIEAMGRSPEVELFAGAQTRSLASLVSQGTDTLVPAILQFARNQERMFTYALLLLGAIGLVRAFRARPDDRNGDPHAARFATIAAFATGIAHVVLFPQGALVHDYWTYLLLPAFALAAAGFVDGLRRRATLSQGEGFGALIALAAVALVAVSSARETRATLAAQEASTLPHALLGKATREQVRPHERVLTNLEHYNPISSRQIILPEFTYYSDRVVRGNVRTEEDLDRAFAEEGPFDWFFLAATGREPIQAVLERRYGEPRRIPVSGGALLYFDLKP